MKTYKTLKNNIEHVLRTGEGWTEEISEWVASDIKQSLNRQFSRDARPKGKLRLSLLGTECERKLWYSTVGDIEPEPLPASTYNKFIFGDLTESYMLGLVKASGHHVVGLQDTVVVHGIRGSRDCVIDGMLFDIKSASDYSFKKFARGGLREDDPFGYISQISSYLYGSQCDSTVTYKDKAGFLVANKNTGEIVVDIYDLTPELEGKQEEVESKKRIVKSDSPPPRPYEQEPDGKSGNMKLPRQCSWCEYKQGCWPELRTFINDTGYTKYLTVVKREPAGSYMEI